METEQNARQEIPAVSFDEFKVPSYDEWHAEADKALKGAPFDKRMYTKTYEGITLDPVYRLEDLDGISWLGARPGEFPYQRGCEAGGYMKAPWTISQPSRAVHPGGANAEARRELDKGAGCVSFELDECTHRGMDPSEELFCGDYRGVSVSVLDDAKTLLRDVDLARYPVHLYAGASASAMCALFAASLDGSALAELKGCIGADPLGELASSGALPVPMDELCDEMALTVLWAAKGAPKLKTVLVRGEPYHNGGANAVQESACAVAAAISYVRAMLARGVELDTALGAIRFSFSLGSNFFMEIARLRAVKAVWAQAARAFGASDEAAKMDITARTSFFTKTKYDPYVNILRTTTEAFSGVVGGVGAMEVGCFDEAVRPGDEQARRIARNIQIMLQTEFDLTSPVDPVGGSWYVEKLTAQAADEIWKYMQKIEAQGGLMAALEAGTVQADIEKVLASRFKNLAVRSDRAVGSNMYPNMVEKPLSVNLDDMKEVFEARTKELEKTAYTHDTERALAQIIPSVHKADESFVENIAAAFAAGATLGEVRKVLNDGFEGSVSVKPIPVHRWTEQFEALRQRTEDFIARTGKNVRIFLANMGPIPQHKARADFSAGFMEVAHFEVLRNNGFASVEDAIAAAKEADADAAVICSTDDTYPELVPPLARGIKAACPGIRVILAGAPAPEFKDAWTEAGVDEYIHVRANCYEILSSIQNAKEGC